MTDDISRILREWEFSPKEVTTRIIVCDDGRERVQLRLDLGILQMEMEGRPDGVRPEGHESWLDYYQHLQESHDDAHVDSPAYELDQEAYERLLFEGHQYHQRYLCLWHLKKYELCARDTQRNLRLFAFVREHTRNERAKLQFDQWRPYVTMIHTRAVATPLVAMQQFDSAIAVVEAGIDAIHEFLEDYGQTERADEIVELNELQKWRQDLLSECAEFLASKGELTVDILRRKLQDAVEREEFEEAAKLRDEIRRRTEKDAPPQEPPQ